MKPDHTEEYICNNCGYTSPVANDACPECKSPMAKLDDGEAHRGTSTQEGDEVDDSHYNSDGMESLEALRAKEDSEDDPPFDDEG